jgi:hypothetical protein
MDRDLSHSARNIGWFSGASSTTAERTRTVYEALRHCSGVTWLHLGLGEAKG